VYDTVRVAKDVAELIEKEHDKGNQVIVNVSGGRKPQASGALFELMQETIWCRELFMSPKRTA
jgi:aspartokinase